MAVESPQVLVPAGDRPSVRRLALAVAVPLAVAALAYALWWISDRLVQIGPVDRAFFGWAVVLPVWILAPVAAGFAWGRLPQRTTSAVAITVVVVVGGTAALLFWLAVAFPDCQYGTDRTAADWVLPSLLGGLVIGGGLAISSLLATSLVRRRHPWWAVLVGAGGELALVFAAIFTAALFLIGPGVCQRPPLT